MRGNVDHMGGYVRGHLTQGTYNSPINTSCQAGPVRSYIMLWNTTLLSFSLYSTSKHSSSSSPVALCFPLVRPQPQRQAPANTNTAQNQIRFSEVMVQLLQLNTLLTSHIRQSSHECVKERRLLRLQFKSDTRETRDTNKVLLPASFLQHALVILMIIPWKFLSGAMTQNLYKIITASMLQAWSMEFKTYSNSLGYTQRARWEDW